MTNIKVEKRLIEAYSITKDAPSYYANIMLDYDGIKKGEIVINSSFGYWSARWNSCGDLREFLIGCDISYLARNFRTDEWFDERNTRMEILSKMYKSKREGKITQEEYNELIDDIDYLFEVGGKKVYCDRIYRHCGFMNLFDQEVSDIPIIETFEPAFDVFMKCIWPSFIDKLKEELKEEENKNE